MNRETAALLLSTLKKVRVKIGKGKLTEKLSATNLITMDELCSYT